MTIHDLKVQAVLCLDLGASGHDDALRELVLACYDKGMIKSPEDVYSRILQREALVSTALNDRFAIPHARLPYIDNVLVAIGRSLRGIIYNPASRQKVHLIFMLLSPEGENELHLRALARIARILKDAAFTDELSSAATDAAFTRILEKNNIGVL